LSKEPHTTPGDMDEAHKSHCIRKVPIFNHLSPAEMAEISRVTASSRFDKGHMIFFTGASAEILYIVHTGQLKQVRVTASGREQIVRILQPGDFVGELALFGRHRPEGYAEALEPSEVCHLRGEDLRALLVHLPDIGVKILGAMAERLGEAEERIEQLGAQTVAQRLAGALLQLTEHREPGKHGLSVTLPYSKGDLASLLGTSQETLSRKLAEFQENGWIEMEGQRHITLLSLPGLRAVLAGDTKP